MNVWTAGECHFPNSLIRLRVIPKQLTVMWVEYEWGKWKWATVWDDNPKQQTLVTEGTVG